MKKIKSWGRLSNNNHLIFNIKNITNIQCEIKNNLPGIMHGLGRSYGDVALNSGGCLWMGNQLNHFISFDKDLGVLYCEAGSSLQDIHRTLVPQGWMLPVTPGTQVITVGGAIANDVHGKNHHVLGSFGDHVLEFTLLKTTGEIFQCSRTNHSELFFATIGGIGLTGIILTAKIQLRAVQGSWLEAETVPYYDLNEFFELADSSEKKWEHTVSWIDCMNGKQARGLFMRANLCDAKESIQESVIKDKIFPIAPPISLVNHLSLPLFNFAYFHKNRLSHHHKIVHYEPFFIL